VPAVLLFGVVFVSEFQAFGPAGANIGKWQESLTAKRSIHIPQW